MHNVNRNIEYKIQNAYIIHTPTQYSRFESFSFFLNYYYEVYNIQNTAGF